MLFFTLWPDKGVRLYQPGLDHLRAHPAVCMEVRELLAMGADRSRRIPLPPGRDEDIPLLSHARYRREEIWRPGLASWKRSARATQLVVWAPATRTDALLVNIRKSEAEFSPRRCTATTRSRRTSSTGVAERHPGGFGDRSALPQP